MGDVGNRPFHERWIFYLIITGALWLRALAFPFDRRTGAETVIAGLSLAYVAVVTPLFIVWHRRNERHRTTTKALS